jgi:hypothetical protein
MPRYSLGVVTSAPLTLAPFAAIRATARTLRIREIQIVQTQATESKVGLVVPKGSPAPVPVATTFQAPVAIDPQDIAATSLVDTAWSTAPTIPDAPVAFQKLADLAAVIGNGATWTFPEPLVVPIGKMIALFNFGGASAGALLVNVLLDE